MNKQQMEMLSVKSAIERTVQGLISSYDKAPIPNPYGMYEEICRYMASLFASRQIDADYTVDRRVNGAIDIQFKSKGQHTALSFMLSPTATKTTTVINPVTFEREEISRQEPLGTEFEKVLYDNIDQLYETDDSRSFQSSGDDPYDYAKKFTR